MRVTENQQRHGVDDTRGNAVTVGITGGLAGWHTDTLKVTEEQEESILEASADYSVTITISTDKRTRTRRR